MKKIILIVIVSLTANIALAQNTSPQAQYSNRGMYMNWDKLGLFGNLSSQQELLEYARSNNITYLCMFGLKSTDKNNTNYPFYAEGDDFLIHEERAQELSNFIVRAKTFYGIEEVGVNVGTHEGASNAVADYNASKQIYEWGQILRLYLGLADQYPGKIDVLSFDEVEFWNTGEYPTKSERTAKYAEFVEAIETMRDVCNQFPKNVLRVETELGYLSKDYVDDFIQIQTLEDNVDRILFVQYGTDPTPLGASHRQFLKNLETAQSTLEIWPLFGASNGTDNGLNKQKYQGFLIEEPNNNLNDLDDIEHAFLDDVNNQYNNGLLNYDNVNYQWGGSMWFKYEQLRENSYTAQNHPFSVSLGAPFIRRTDCPVAIQAEVQGGVPPYNYTFTNENGAVLQNSNSPIYVTNAFNAKIFVKATDNVNQQSTDYKLIYNRDNYLTACRYSPASLVEQTIFTETCFEGGALSPNPASGDVVNLTLKGYGNVAVTITISNILFGKVIFQEVVALNDGDNVIQIDVSNFSRGLYSLKVNCDTYPERVLFTNLSRL